MRNKITSNTRGAALIEAALILPVLLVIVLAMADLAFFLWQLNSAQKAVQLGARRAIVSEPVAIGPGLTARESIFYWKGLPLGERCAPPHNGQSICPVFSVSCRMNNGCLCMNGSCDFALAELRLAAIVDVMRSALPQLKLEQVEISYATNYLGYVGRPLPVPVDVSVKIVRYPHEPNFFSGAVGPALSISASVTLPSEYMRPSD